MMTKYCRKCGCEIKDDPLFCPKCGVYIERSKNKISFSSKWFLIGIIIVLLVVLALFLFNGNDKTETNLSMLSQSNSHSSNEYVVKLTDSNNKSLEGRFIDVEFNNNTYALKTDSEGLAKINLTLSEGSNEVKSYFKGDNEYLESHSSDILVK